MSVFGFHITLNMCRYICSVVCGGAQKLCSLFTCFLSRAPLWELYCIPQSYLRLSLFIPARLTPHLHSFFAPRTPSAPFPPHPPLVKYRSSCFQEQKQRDVGVVRKTRAGLNSTVVGVYLNAHCRAVASCVGWFGWDWCLLDLRSLFLLVELLVGLSAGFRVCILCVTFESDEQPQINYWSDALSLSLAVQSKLCND